MGSEKRRLRAQAELEFWREAYAACQKRLEAQNGFGLAADQRSLVLAGVSIAAATLVRGDGEAWTNKPYLVLAVLLFIVAFLFSAWSAMPVKMHVQGADYKSLGEAVEDGISFGMIFRGLCENTDEAVAENEEERRRQNRRYRAAIYFLFLGAIFFALSELGISGEVLSRGAQT